MECPGITPGVDGVKPGLTGATVSCLAYASCVHMPSVDAGNAEARPDAGNADAQTDAGNVESWHDTVNAGRDARARRPPPTRVWRRVLTSRIIF